MCGVKLVGLLVLSLYWSPILLFSSSPLLLFSSSLLYQLPYFQFLFVLSLQNSDSGVHACRHGDACVHAAQSNTRPLCRPFLDYLPPLAEMRDRYNVSTVFLSTDDADVAKDAPAALAKMVCMPACSCMPAYAYIYSHTITHAKHARAHTHTHAADV